MKSRWPVLIFATAILAGCHKAEVAGGGSHHGGRYLGIGTYPASELWQHLVHGGEAKDHQGATLADDDQIIVTVDSRTGEVRQCGNLSGYCVGSSPWKTQAAPAPAILSKHAAELRAERQAEMKETLEDASAR